MTNREAFEQDCGWDKEAVLANYLKSEYVAMATGWLAAGKYIDLDESREIAKYWWESYHASPTY